MAIYLACLPGDKQDECGATTGNTDKFGLLGKRSHLTASYFLSVRARFTSENLIIVCMILWDPEEPSKMCMTCKYWLVFVPKENEEGEWFLFLSEDVIAYDKVYYPLERKGKKEMSLCCNKS